MSDAQNIDEVLRKWPYRPGEVLARRVESSDGRDVLQMRVDMGILQLEIDGRPDGSQPEGFETYYDYLISLSLHEGEDFVLDEEMCFEIDREFVQFYHRRICWLAIREYRHAALDADHTLALMDFGSAHASNDDWALSHEQYRPFVLFHRTQAVALSMLEQDKPLESMREIDEGLELLRELFAQYDAEEQYEEDSLVQRLVELRETVRQQYQVGPTLNDQLDAAVASEDYELAARLRDELRQRGEWKPNSGGSLSERD